MGRPHPREEALLGSDRRPLGQWGWRLDQRRTWEQIRSQSCSPWISKDWGWAPRLPIASVWVSNPPQTRRMPDRSVSFTACSEFRKASYLSFSSEFTVFFLTLWMASKGVFISSGCLGVEDLSTSDMLASLLLKNYNN